VDEFVRLDGESLSNNHARIRAEVGCFTDMLTVAGPARRSTMLPVNFELRSATGICTY
jgi:hypothetical protein